MGINKNTKKAMFRQDKRMKELEGAIKGMKDHRPLVESELPSPKEYGKLVRKYRKEAGYSLRKAALEIGTTFQTLQAIEAGNRSTINLNLAYIIMVVFGCSADNLCGKVEKRGAILRDGKEYRQGITFAPPEEKDIGLALLNIHKKHPELANRIHWLAKYGTDADLQKADDLLVAAFGEVFADSSI